MSEPVRRRSRWGSVRGCPVLSSHSLRLSVTSGAPHQGLFLGDFHGYIVRNSFVSAGGALNWKNWGAGVTVAKLADHNPRLPTKGCPPSQGTTALKQIAIVLFPQRCDCSRLLTSSDFVKVFTIVSVVQIRALSTTDLRPATTCPCKAHTEAQAALASWRKAYMEAQAALASGRAPRQALLLDRAVAVREICLRG